MNAIRRIAAFAAFAFLLAALPACAQNYKTISAEEFRTLQKSQPGQVLDVRTVEEYKSGHLPGALHYHIYDQDFKARIAKLDKTKTYYVYCLAGSRSADASSEMAALGFTHVYNIAGGITKLKEAGFQVVK